MEALGDQQQAAIGRAHGLLATHEGGEIHDAREHPADVRQAQVPGLGERNAGKLRQRQHLPGIVQLEQPVAAARLHTQPRGGLGFGLSFPQPLGESLLELTQADLFCHGRALFVDRRDLRQQLLGVDRFHQVILRAWRIPQTRSVSWFLLVTTITGMCLVASSRVMARVAWKPLVPGMTTSIRMRAGLSDFDLVIASSPFSAVTTWYPCLDSVSMKNCRSVCESSTIKSFFMAMAISSGTNGRVRPYGFQKTILREWLGQVFVRT